MKNRTWDCEPRVASFDDDAGRCVSTLSRNYSEVIFEVWDPLYWIKLPVISASVLLVFESILVLFDIRKGKYAAEALGRQK